MFRSFLPLILLGAAACDPSDKVAPATDSDGSDDTATVPCGVTYYLDSDADGYGDPSVSTCDEVAPIGYVINDQDCDDSDPATYPGALELCSDGQDQDCDGELDERDWYYTDSDGDGYGDEDSANFVCSPEPGSVSNGSDCDDSNADINPGATEYCDSNDVDENCDGQADGADADGARDWYIDADGDGYGDEDSLVTSCERPDGAIEKGGDCDDDEATAWPGAPEICDGLPNNCEEWDLWTNADEANTVSFVGEDGEVMDLTADVSTTSSDVSELVIQTSGTLRFCADPDTGTTWYVSIEAASIDLTVEGPLGDELTVLSGGSVSRAIEANVVNLTLVGLTLRDGFTSGDGGAIWLSNGRLSIESVRFVANEARGNGGGIYVYGAASASYSVNLQDSAMDENYAGGSGGAIFTAYNSVTMTNVAISNNSANSDGGGIASSGSSLTGNKLTVTLNEADNGGGIYSVYGSSLKLEDGTRIEYNESNLAGAGIYTSSEGSLDLDGDVSVVGNKAGTAGGAVFAASSTNVYVLNGAVVSDNSASNGGAFYLYKGTTLNVEGAEITDNTATLSGGAFFLFDRSDTVVVECGGGAIINGNHAKYDDGDGFFLREAATITATDCHLADDVYVYDIDSTYDLSAVTAFTCDVDGCE